MPTILVIARDFFSHYAPLAHAGAAWRDHGADVVMATGPAMESHAREAGFVHRLLRLGPSSKPPQLVDEAFFEATKQGVAATAMFSAARLARGGLPEPEAVVARVEALLADVQPDLVLVDHFALGATLALRVLEQPYVGFVPTHPAFVPAPGEVFGFPHAVPAGMEPSPGESDELRRACAQAAASFTEGFNLTLQSLNPRAEPVRCAFGALSPWLTLVNHPPQLGAGRQSLPPDNAHLIGALVRDESLPADLDTALPDTQAGRVLVSLGTFLSPRRDVLERIVQALRTMDLDVVMAVGANDPSDWDVPSSWLVRAELPQVGLLPRCDLLITHGGNNSALEAMAAGVPLAVCPFAADQFAVARDVERHELGTVFDPNRATPSEIAAQVRRALSPICRERMRELAAALRRDPAGAVSWRHAESLLRRLGSNRRGASAPVPTGP
jgi:zeaxanthin glucosyltransferase